MTFKELEDLLNSAVQNKELKYGNSYHRKEDLDKLSYSDLQNAVYLKVNEILRENGLNDFRVSCCGSRGNVVIYKSYTDCWGNKKLDEIIVKITRSKRKDIWTYYSIKNIEVVGCLNRYNDNKEIKSFDEYDLYIKKCELEAQRRVKEEVKDFIELLDSYNLDLDKLRDIKYKYNKLTSTSKNRLIDYYYDKKNNV